MVCMKTHVYICYGKLSYALVACMLAISSPLIVHEQIKLEKNKKCSNFKKYH